MTDLLAVNRYLDVSFVFIQAKTTGNFNGAEMAAFIDGVKLFFDDEVSVPMNEEIIAARAVMNAVYENGAKFGKGKPTCRLYYVTTGKWTNEPFLAEKINARVRELESTNLFANVTHTPWGADELHTAYQRSKNNVTAEFIFDNKVVLPEINGVSQAYLGVLPVSQFLSIITDDSDGIRKALFYDNIRDFQDYNDVNKDIQETLANKEAHQRFAVLNNGVTIVARELDAVGNKFTMTDYQIVNGCQTSHVIYDERAKLGDGIFVPVKIIVTEDEDLTSAVIRATNRQTEVTAEDLYALSAFQKKLEDLYASYPPKKRLYYERRLRQYNSAEIEKVRVITKQQQIRAFAAMFLDDPHRASRYYADLKALVPERIFNETHKPDPYYISAYGYYKLEFFFRNGSLPSIYKPARYHILMAFRYICGGPDMPALSANKMESYCNKIATRLWDDKAVLNDFSKAIEAVDAAANGAPITRDSVKTQSFTDAVKRELGVKSTK
ncbi:MAG TPA: AIPR family protein [Candidatus Saccharimonadia bacterium]